MQLLNYISNINRLYTTGEAREHSYRGDLQQLLKDIINNDNIIITNEPAHIRDVGAPDFSIKKGDIPLGYIEAKDIGKPLNSKTYKEQFDRYKNALDNLIITDYLEFWFYRDGELKTKISIAKIEDNKIVPIEENFEEFKNLILDFTTYVSKTIISPSKLAKLMAGKARLLQDIIQKAIESDEQKDENNSLRNEMRVFKQNLIHDITPASFADIYAQTIAYGLFAARLHDTTLQDFSRAEAQYLIPKSNPFLRGLFNYISGPDCDERLVWIIDSLAEIFLATDVKKILKGFSQKSGMDDPIIHFYETFLAEYNPKLRKSRGVWYTPEAVVNFIVRACDEILKDEFALEEGLLDDSKIKIKVDDINAGYTKSGKMRQKEKEVHKVQILDPATGTGTFLAQTIKHIKNEFWGGSWSNYVENSLIPRLNGFEILMASYAMAHLKLDLLLMESGYKPINQKRFNIYLTNSLEEHHEHTGTLFSSYLANESKEADRIKKETPVMVVMGNPPYSVSSSNKGKWIQELLKDYKKDLNERKTSLDDDYIKFIRYGQYYIDKNTEGILAYISNNSFIDGVTHRQMRKFLLESFDKIYILDLHGNSKKKETTPDGKKDENVFDIMQGVSINIFVKTSNSKKLADVYHYDLYGKREFKYEFLNENNLEHIKWEKLNYNEPNYFFYKNNDNNDKYLNFIQVNKIFKIHSTGIQTSRDNISHSFTKEEQIFKNNEFSNKDISDSIIRNKYFQITSQKYPKGDTRDWKLSINREKAYSHNLNNDITFYCFRPFDYRYITYNEILISWSRKEVAKHLLKKDNYSLIAARSSSDNNYNSIFCSRFISDVKCGERTKGSIFIPLYIYPDDNSLEQTREPNLNKDIVAKFEKALNLSFTSEKKEDTNTFAPIDILDYIYAILHSPDYREKYKEFLKIDFPRVPYPNPKTFWQLVELGSKLRKIHLLEDKSLEQRVIDIIGEGEMLIENKLNKKDVTIKDDIVTLSLNSNISITNIPLIAWEFYIGGYQPAQKWLKDRVGRELSRADIKHYNKIINALIKTEELMKKCDICLLHNS